MRYLDWTQRNVIFCEESGHVSLSYNVLLTTPKVKAILHVVTFKSTSTYINCGKIGHTLETCHNQKREIPIIPTTIVNTTRNLVLNVTIQFVTTCDYPSFATMFYNFNN